MDRMGFCLNWRSIPKEKDNHRLKLTGRSRDFLKGVLKPNHWNVVEYAEYPTGITNASYSTTSRFCMWRTVITEGCLRTKTGFTVKPLHKNEVMGMDDQVWLQRLTWEEVAQKAKESKNTIYFTCRQHRTTRYTSSCGPRHNGRHNIANSIGLIRGKEETRCAMSPVARQNRKHWFAYPGKLLENRAKPPRKVAGNIMNISLRH